MTTRDIVQEHFIQAAPATVWAAFTEGQHIRNWFAPFADSDPRLGGYIHLQWDEAVGGGQQCVITEWEVERRLVMTWRDAPDEVGKLPVEVTLQARDGGTLLTLTHSGFLSDASWDDEFDSHGRGWTYELKCLRHYVENMFGQPRSIMLERIPMADDWSEQWAALVGPVGMIRVMEGLADAAECVIGLPTGEESRAHVLNALTEKDFAAVLEALQGGVIRLTFETFAGGPELWFWTSSWHLDEAQLRAVTQPWYNEIRQRLGAMVKTQAADG